MIDVHDKLLPGFSILPNLAGISAYTLFVSLGLLAGLLYLGLGPSGALRTGQRFMPRSRGRLAAMRICLSPRRVRLTASHPPP